MLATIQKALESGEKYIKFPNGVAICWGTHAFSNCTFVSSGNVYRYTVSNLNISFPITFTSTPAISVQTANDADYSWCTCIGVTRDASKITQLCFMRDAASSGGMIYWHYIAIGRWK